MSSSNSPCAACKLQRRKCTLECIFAPYFPPDLPQKFAKVHKVFGASNVQKLLSELPSYHREDAVNSLAFEADARLKDPIYGCVGQISMLQHNLGKLQNELKNAKKELANYIGPTALFSMLPAAVPGGGYMPSQVLGHPSTGVTYNMPMMGMQRPLVIRDPQQQEQQFLQQQQEMYEAQQLAMAMEQQQDVKRIMEQQQNMQRQHLQEDLVNFDGGLNGSSTVTATGINQITNGSVNSPSLDLDNFQNLNMNSPEMEKLQAKQHQLQPQLLLQQPEKPQECEQERE